MTRNKKLIIAGVTLALVAGITILYLGPPKDIQQQEIIDRLFPTAQETTELAPIIAIPKTHPAPGTEKMLGTPAATNVEPGTLLLLSADSIASLALVGTTTRYHKNIPENLGHLFERKADASDKEKRVSNFTIPQILKVVWSKDAKRSVIFYNLNDVVRKILVDYTGTSTPKTNFLPDSVGDIAFSPDSKSLAYTDELEASTHIYIATADFRNPRKIFDNTIPRLELMWPTASQVAIKTKSSAAIAGFLYTINTQSGTLKKIVEGTGLDAIWNSDASGVIYSSSQNLTLRYLDIKSGATTELGIKTVAEKCTASATSKNIFYCGVPKNPQRATYPDAWWQGKVIFEDEVVMIDTTTGDKKIIKNFGGDIIHPLLTQNDAYLLFTDKTSGALWSLKLK